MQVKCKSSIDVELIQSCGGDHMVVAAAKVSTNGTEAEKFADPSLAGDNYGLINYLMKCRHGSPFEHGSMTFFVNAPIFVWREWHRHRIGFCVAGDTNVMLETISNSGRTIRKRRIADLCHRWNHGVVDKAHARRAGSSGYTIAVKPRARMLSKCRDFTMRVLNEDTQFFELGKPSNIFESGVKEMLLVDTGKNSLKCSKDHRVYTDQGWVPAGDLRKGDLVAVCGNSEQKLAQRCNVAGTKFVKLVSTPNVVSEEMSYDITMGGQHHNFVANGIVVHNSYNEESGRYKKLEPVFYIPEYNRPMMKVDDWKPGRPKFKHAPPSTLSSLWSNLLGSYQKAYDEYEKNLALGIDPGLARDCLPVGIFSSCWVTCNPRSLMAFLSLRVHDPEAKFPSYPLWEIQNAAIKCESLFATQWPLTHQAFNANGRVAP